MSFTTLLELLALIAFVLAAIGFSWRKTEFIAIGLLLWSLGELIPRLSSITVSTIVLLLAVVAFAAASFGYRYRKVNTIAVGLALWVLSILLPALLHIS